MSEGPGYPRTTKLLHWATFVVLAAQVLVGYQLGDDGDDVARARIEAREERLEDRADRDEGREERLEERADAVSDRDEDGSTPLLPLHIGLGLTVLCLALVRLVRRRVVPLPPWAEQLSGAERAWAHRTEQALYVALVAMPLSGIGLLLVSDDLLPLHVASHVLLYVSLAAHVGLVLRHQLVLRDGLLRRML
jgi:cytochrome b561